MFQLPRRSWLAVVGLMCLWLIVACGPAPETLLEDAAPAATTPSEETASPDNLAEAAPIDPESDAPADNAAPAETVDDLGIPVGFTAEGRPYRGRLDAPVQIEEFSDYQCPFCARFTAQTKPSLDENQIASGDAVLIFYDFPLNIHPQAPAAAHAARCAGEQGAKAYWQMHDSIFENTEAWSIADPTDVFVDLAGELGLDQAAFEACQTSNRYEEAVQADYNLGLERGVRGTPTFFINGQAVSGAQPITVFDRAIEAAKSGEPVAQESEDGTEPVTEEDIDLYMPQPVTLSGNFAASLGDPNAPVVIAEFTDYQCPFCARHSLDTMPRLLSDMIETGRVYYTLYDLPLESIHPDARLAAGVARCAGEQGAYWEMHDTLFARQAEWSGQGNGWFVDLAGSLNLNEATFKTCLDEQRYDSAVQANLDEASQIGLNGTPSFLIQGYNLFSGAQPYDVFNQVVELVEQDNLVNTIRNAIRQQLESQRAQQAPPPTPSGPVDVPLGEDDIAIGDPDAPIVLVEYTDYQCPFCSRHHAQTYPQLIQDYVDTGLVRYVFKDFPLESIHPQANLASQAARCAHEQNAFLTMHDRLFETQSEWGNEQAAEIFAGYAKEMGLDEADFTECLNSGKYESLIASQLQEGLSLGVQGTPAFFVNGNPISGAQPFSVFQQMIDDELEN